MAFRYGILLEGNENEFVYKKTKSWDEKSNSIDVFHVANRKVILAVDRINNVVITALPEHGIWQTFDAIAVAGMLDIACTTPPLMPIESILEWRDQYIEGSLSKDDIKKIIRRSKNELLNKNKINDKSLEIIEHLTDKNIEKDIEIVNLRSKIQELSGLTQDKVKSLENRAMELQNIIINNQESNAGVVFSDALDVNADSGGFEQYVSEPKHLYTDRLISQASVKFPWSYKEVGRFNNKPVYEIENCRIESIIKPEDEFSQSIYQLLFSYEGEQYLVTTYYENFIDYYANKIGETTSVYKILYNGKQFLHTPLDIN